MVLLRTQLIDNRVQDVVHRASEDGVVPLAFGSTLLSRLRVLLLCQKHITYMGEWNHVDRQLVRIYYSRLKLIACDL